MLGVVLVHACGEAEGIVGGLTTLLAEIHSVCVIQSEVVVERSGLIISGTRLFSTRKSRAT